MFVPKIMLWVPNPIAEELGLGCGGDPVRVDTNQHGFCHYVRAEVGLTQAESIITKMDEAGYPPISQRQVTEAEQALQHLRVKHMLDIPLITRDFNY